MSYRDDMAGYDPTEASPPPPEAPRRAPRRGPSRLSWVYRVGAVVLIATALWRLGLWADGDEAAAPTEQSTQERGEVPTSPASTPAPTVEDTPEAPEPTGSAPSSPSSTAAEGEPVEVAREFVAAWAHPKRSADDWYTAVYPLATPDFAVALKSVRPSNVPATEVRSVRVKTVSGGLAVVEATTDGPSVRVEVTETEAGWLVSGIAPVRDATANPSTEDA